MAAHLKVKIHANIVKNLANSPLLPSILALLARIVILNLYRLALIEVPLSAIERDNKLKKWRRTWRLKLIEDFNPAWNDLYDSFFS
jgi:hypothetical protein